MAAAELRLARPDLDGERAVLLAGSRGFHDREVDAEQFFEQTGIRHGGLSLGGSFLAKKP